MCQIWPLTNNKVIILHCLVSEVKQITMHDIKLRFAIFKECVAKILKWFLVGYNVLLLALGLSVARNRKKKTLKMLHKMY